jgi:ABC-type amino acid transport substrate-binding protein
MSIDPIRACRPVAVLALAASLMLDARAQGQAPVAASARATPPTSAAALPPTLTKIRGTGVIAIGHRTDAVPFAYLDADKQPIGYGVDLCKQVVATLRRELAMPALKVEYVPVTAANRFEAIRSGRADMECSLTVNNPARRKEAGFALPYFFAGPRILTGTESGIRDFADLGGRRVVAARGANAIPILQARIDSDRLRGTVLVQVENNTLAFAALEKGEADAFVTTDNLLHALRATSREPARWHVVGSYLVMEAVAIVLRHGDVEFKRVVDRALAGLMIDGVATRTYAKWFTQPVPVPGSPEQRVIDIPMSSLLRDQMRWPTDSTGDE